MTATLTSNASTGCFVTVVVAVVAAAAVREMTLRTLSRGLLCSLLSVEIRDGDGETT